jgi:hypothetical protein
MRRRLANRTRAGVFLAAFCLTSGVGCTHNHYYYTTPGAIGVPAAVGPCDPVPGTTVISSNRPVIGTPLVGSVCDDPPQGSFLMGNRVGPTYSYAGGPFNPQPIYSQPSARPLRRGGLAWRGNNNAQSVATTKVDGDYNDESTTK